MDAKIEGLYRDGEEGSPDYNTGWNDALDEVGRTLAAPDVTGDAEVEGVALGVKEYLAERTGFQSDQGEGIVAAYYGGNWITLDTTKVARAALSALRSTGSAE